MNSNCVKFLNLLLVIIYLSIMFLFEDLSQERHLFHCRTFRRVSFLNLKRRELIFQLLGLETRWRGLFREDPTKLCLLAKVTYLHVFIINLQAIFITILLISFPFLSLPIFRKNLFLRYLGL